MDDQASYTCPSCGEQIVVPVDVSAGADQDYVEDCPVCCCPNQVHVHIGRNGSVRISVESES